MSSPKAATLVAVPREHGLHISDMHLSPQAGRL
jgi:hypothetical protein